MIDALAFALAIGCVVAAIVIGIRFVRISYTWKGARPLLVALEVGLIVQLALSVIGLVAGHHPAEPATFVAYAASSVLVFPAAVTFVRGDDGGWAALLVLVAFVVAAVLVVRMQTTWRSA